MKTTRTFYAVSTVALFATVVPFHKTETTELPAPTLRTAKVQRGDLSHTISAKGTIRPEELVEVGAQVTGMIAAFGSDPADPSRPLDCGSYVRKDTMLAQIDPTMYKAQVDYASASLLRAKADLQQCEARRDQMELEWKRAQKLLADKAIASTDFELALTNLRVIQASVAASRAAVQQNEATLHIAQTNLAYTTIKSPFDGIVVDRRVDIGQTVVAAFNAPGLFLIAKNSQQMRVWASVDEADIGYIRPGLPVRFTVNARGDEVFEGRVAQIRLNPTRSENAVTYTVIVAASASGNMLPYMTANLQFEIERHPNVFLLPNDALQHASDNALEISTSASNELAGRPARLSPEKLAGACKTARLWKERKMNRCLWVKDGRMVRPIEVQIGVSNGAMTEVIGKDVWEGMEVCLRDGA